MLEFDTDPSAWWTADRLLGACTTTSCPFLLQRGSRLQQLLHDCPLQSYQASVNKQLLGAGRATGNLLVLFEIGAVAV